MIEFAIEILLFVICVLFTAFFSSSEVALISITRAKARTLANEGKKGSEAVTALKDSPEHLLITILIGNTLVTTAAAAIATAVAIQIFGDIGVGIATVFVVVVLLVFGEMPQDLCSTGIGFICSHGCSGHPVRLPDFFPNHLDC